MILFITLGGCASDHQKADAFIREGKAYFEKQEYVKAEIQLKNAVKLAPESTEALHLLAQVYLQQKNPQKAFTSFLRLEQLEPDNLETKLQLASFYFLAWHITKNGITLMRRNIWKRRLNLIKNLKGRMRPGIS